MIIGLVGSSASVANMKIDVAGLTDLTLYFIIQPFLNVLFGFIFGYLAPWVIRNRSWTFWLWLWILLMVFVSVRIVGDWLMGIPTPASGESFRLLLYATSFMCGLVMARWLRMGHEVHL